MKLLHTWILISLLALISMAANSQVTGQRNIQYASAPPLIQASLMVKGYGENYIQTSCEYLRGSEEEGNSYITVYDSSHNIVLSIKLINYFVRSICEDADGNFYTIGIDAGLLLKISLLKISSSGNVLWKKSLLQTNNSNIFFPDYYPYDFYKAILLSNGNILFNCYNNYTRALLVCSANDGTLLKSAEVPAIVGDIEQGFNNTLTAVYFDRSGFFGDFASQCGLIQFDLNLRVIRNKKITSPSSLFMYGLSIDKSGFYYVHGVDSTFAPSPTAGGVVIKLDSQLNSINNNSTEFIKINKKGCRPGNDGLFFKVTVNDHSVTVIENQFFLVPQNPITYNNTRYVSVPVLNFDTSLTVKWSKIFLIRQDSLNPLFMLSDDIIGVKDNFIFSLRSASPNAFLFYLDTAGNTGSCYHKEADYVIKKFTTTFIDTTFSISTSLFVPGAPDNFTTAITDAATISLECVPPLKPVSNFISNYNLTTDTTTICLNTAVNFIDSTKNDPSVFNWIFPPEADLSTADSTCFPDISNVLFTSQGIYPVLLVACNNSGCDTSKKFISTITSATKPNLGNDTTICPGDSIAIIYRDTLNSTHEFTGSNGLVSSRDTVFIKESGTYQCTVVSNCGIFSDEISVTVLKKPVAEFASEIVCDSLKVTFIDSSQTNGNTDLIYSWSFFSAAGILIGSNNIQNPVFSFPAFDSFDVKLTVRSRNNCVTGDSISKRIYLKTKPVAAFTTINDCGSLQASFINNSTATTDSIEIYLWDFGDGRITNEKNPIVSFPSYGPKAIQLTAISSLGCSSNTISQNILIKEKPTATILYGNNACANTAFTLTASTNIVTGNIINNQWWLNDIPQASIADSLNIIKPAARYTIKYIAVSDKGCASDTATKDITIEESPSVNASIQNGCIGIPVNFSSQVLSGSASTHRWYFGDGDTGNLSTGSHTYLQPGTFTVRYIAGSTNNCPSNTDTVLVNIESIPVADFSSGNICVGQPLDLSAAASSNAIGSIINYQWLFNGSVDASGVTVTVPSVTAGTFSVVLKVSTNNGCTAQKITAFEINKTTISAGADASVPENASYTLQGSGGVRYEWKPADLLNNATIANPVAILKNDQLFILEATDANGCTGYDSVLIKVIGNVFIPTAFSPSGVNKVWRIKSLDAYKSVQLAVYNRYGQKVFEGSAANNYTWDGTFKNKAQPSGAYVYTLQTDDGKRVRNFKGTVMLVR